MDTQKTTNGLQVIGEGTGVGKSTLHMVGYLGKNCNPLKTASHEYCPVCKEKGQIQALRTYRINFQESIYLCENPQCIYPLGYKPLNSIITSADSEDHLVSATHKKRKLCGISDFSPLESRPKKERTNKVVDVEDAVKTDHFVECTQKSLLTPKSSLRDVLQNDQQKPNNSVGSCTGNRDIEPTNSCQESLPKTYASKTQLLPNSEFCSTTPETLLKDDKKPTNNTDLCLQWRNVHNLCWLDCILSALVHLETLKPALAEEYNDGGCLLQKLLTKYNQATVLLNTCKKSKVKDVLPKAESHLNEIRSQMFTQLQPQLKCKLGEKESPVFALPLLLKMDQQAEKLFMHSFSWKFECVRCGYKYQERFRKTLTTFTNITPDWHPLNAVHVGPCRSCDDRSQRRRMMLEKVPSVLMLHFVEGLPHNKLKNYSFQLEEDTYQITSVVQYQTDKQHFITWSLNPDGTWLECDDIKGPYCKRHKKFEVPPSEIHIVIWEKETSHMPGQLTSQLQNKSSEDFSLSNVQSSSTALNRGSGDTADKTPKEHRREGSVRIPDKKEQGVFECDRAVCNGVENLARDDLVTLMLEEIEVDSGGKTLLNGQMVGDNLAVEMGTLQQQEPAFSTNTPRSGEFAGTGLVVNSKCTLYEDSSICLPLEGLNPANVTAAVPKKHNPGPPDSLLAQTGGERTNLPIRQPGSRSELQLNKKLSCVEHVTQKWPDLKDTSPSVVNSQVDSSATANTSFQPSHKDQTRGFVGSWVKKLLNKSSSFMPSGASVLKSERSCKTPSVKKLAEVRLPVKGASNFGGFQSRGTNKTAELLKSGVPQSNKPQPSSNFKGFSQSTCLPTANHTANAGPAWNKSGSTLGTSGRESQFHSPVSSSGKAEESDSEKTKKLRLKLLKKLNAKKRKLASLDRLAVEQMNPDRPGNGAVGAAPQTESHSDSDLLQSFLRELQHQIDVADKDTELNANSVSGCSSHSDEILAEILSPTSTSASLEAPRSEEECMYMEMVDSSAATAVSAEKTDVPHVAGSSEDHNYYSPVKDRNSGLHSTSKSSVKKLAFESPPGEDILEDLFSISVPSAVAGDIDLPHFDETLFETW
ncbi:USPL1 isopeptidase, partial [Rhinopomastus cyanomelas]|nr:USPL1 isopeptidase [Rhinopomastus cyanomelas]